MSEPQRASGASGAPVGRYPVTTAVRAVLLLLVAGVGLASGSSGSSGLPRLPAVLWVLLLAIAAIPGLIAPDHAVVSRLSRIAEVAVAGLGATITLPYLPAPVFAAALYVGATEAIALAGIGTLLIAAVGLFHNNWISGDFALPAVEWIFVTLATALIGAWVRRTVRESAPPPPYTAATRLLTQLRSVARQLPGGTLDPGGLATHLLDEVAAVVPVNQAAVLGASGGARLVVLAQRGPDRIDWETSLDADTPVSDAWATQQPQVSARSVSRSAGVGAASTLVIPLVAGVRTVGLVAVESAEAHAYPPAAVAAVAELATPAALRLEAALLFDEVRTLATSEERQRLAREIHDGVAQELVMVGYGIDNALAALGSRASSSEATSDPQTPGDDDAPAAAELRVLRGEVTRVINELRLSLFELRSEVDRHGGVSTAVAEYARTVGASAGLRVHLSLDESTARLPAATEAELLRIAQEAITNARKHALAENLWVTCEVDPPYARIEISDDGQGISSPRADGRYGLAIMAERAERVRAQLAITPRQPRGTTVSVLLGAPPQGSVSRRPKEVSAGDVH